MSLFQEIPLTRMCEDSGIPAIHCVCQNYQPLSINSSTAAAVVDFVVGYIYQTLLTEHHTQCSKWVSPQVKSAKVRENERNEITYFLTFEVNSESNQGFVATFEATVRQLRPTAKYEIDGDILRISAYGHTSDCMNDHHLRAYCFCK